ncbi:ferric-rhodotorulic acid transporter [Halomonas huangheensis]|nr:ferric-rhodotorulic acid transporter [Halomonas huangheensis]
MDSATHPPSLPKTISLTTLASLVLLGSGAALAQPTTSDSPGNTGSASGTDSTTSNSQLDTMTVTATNLYENVGYTRRSTSAGTRLELSPREVPQSISTITQQRIQDQNLETIEDVLANTTGISTRSIDSNRIDFYARGFRINSYQYDGIPTLNTDNRWYFGEGALNTAIYDRVEVVRGANGLMTGAGNPGASVNFIRKHADSQQLTGSLSGSVGSWDQQRAVADVSTPLTESGNVRARFIGGYDESDGELDRYNERTAFGYLVIDADITDDTTLSVGYDVQNTHANSPTWGGLPLWYSDGSETDYPRSFSSAPDWSYQDFESEKVFVDLSHRFANGWELRGAATHAKTDLDARLMYASGFPDRNTGLGVTNFTGWNRGKRQLDSLDLYTRGPFELAGREHELVAGISYSNQSNDYDNSFAPAFAAGDFNHWDGSTPDPDWSEWTPLEGTKVLQRAMYGATRLSLADPLTLILGARYTEWDGDSWSSSGGSRSQSQESITPYAGLIYDINDQWSAFLSYTEIFQPQDNRDADGDFLDPVVGRNYETGLKADWFDGLLTASVSVFRIEQDNVAQADPLSEGSIETTYHAAEGVVSEGIDFELNGAVTDNLDLTLGASHYTAIDSDGPYNTDQPRTKVDLFGRYRVPHWQQLVVGGGLSWQSHTYTNDAAGPQGTTTFSQGSYTLADLFGRYQFTPQVALQVNIKNLFDEKYYSYLDGYGVYGDPRSATATLSYAF